MQEQALLQSSLVKLTKAVEMETIRIEIGKIISTILKDIGIQNYPDQYAQKRIIYYLLRYYKDFSLTEIRQAFELALTGQVKVNAEHYQSFDMRYVSRILNAFREFRRVRSLAHNPLDTPLTSLQYPSEVGSQTPNLRYLSRLAGVLDRVQSFEKLHIVHTIAYNKLIEEDILQVSEQDWIKFMAKAELQHKAKLRQSRTYEAKRILQAFSQVKYQYPFELTRIQRIAKKIAVIEFLQELKTSGQTINTLLNHKTIKP
jgi:hypothetical protein